MNLTTNNRTNQNHAKNIDYGFTIRFKNADLRAKRVNVARLDGRQKSSLPGCFPCALMWRNILDTSPFTRRLLFTCRQQQMLFVRTIERVKRLWKHRFHRERYWIQERWHVSGLFDRLTHTSLFCSSTTPSKKKTSLMPADENASTHFFRTSMYSLHCPPHTQSWHEYQWRRQAMASTTSVGSKQERN